MKERMISTDVIVEAFSDALALNLGFNPHAVLGISSAAAMLNIRLDKMLVGWDSDTFEIEIASKTQQKRARGMGPGGGFYE